MNHQDAELKEKGAMVTMANWTEFNADLLAGLLATKVREEFHTLLCFIPSFRQA